MTQVYTWFLSSHHVSMTLGVAGYILMLTFFWMEPLYSLILPPGLAPQLLLYGIYFGVLGRDVAEFTSDYLVCLSGRGTPGCGSGGAWTKRA